MRLGANMGKAAETSGNERTSRAHTLFERTKVSGASRPSYVARSCEYDEGELIVFTLLPVT